LQSTVTFISREPNADPVADPVFVSPMITADVEAVTVRVGFVVQVCGGNAPLMLDPPYPPPGFTTWNVKFPDPSVVQLALAGYVTLGKKPTVMPLEFAGQPDPPDAVMYPTPPNVGPATLITVPAA
jgi:hypothetical protein